MGFRGQFDFAWAGGSFRQTTSGPVIDGEAVEIEEPIEKLPAGIRASTRGTPPLRLTVISSRPDDPWAGT